MQSKRTLIEAFVSLKTISDRGITFVDKSSSEEFISFTTLYKKAIQVSEKLKDRGVKRKDEVILFIESNRNFLISFWGCILGGFIPVPVSAGSSSENKSKLRNVWAVLERPHILVDTEKTDLELPGNLICIDPEDAPNEDVGSPNDPAQNDIAYIQFSSGSTGDPKGVVLTHDNLVANATDIVNRSHITEKDTLLSWMPLTHDMGMICFHLSGVLLGLNQVIISTSLFIKRPLIWFDKANQHRASLLYSPNFGLHYFLSAFKRLGTLPTWDLSNVRLLYNGAEPISKKLCEDFSQTLNPLGLKANVIFPGYGLAEASVAVTLPDPSDKLVGYFLERNRLRIGDEIVFVEPGKGIDFVELGYPVDKCQIRICGNNDIKLPEEHIGHIQIRGDNVTGGYYRNAVATADVFTSDGWLKTGDLGFIRHGRLTVTGRFKNIIIVNGQNYYPQDLERCISEVEDIGFGRVAVSSSRHPDRSENALIVYIHSSYRDKLSEFSDRINERLLENFGTTADFIVPVKRIPKTTSGKVQYYKLNEEFERGEFLKTQFESAKTDSTKKNEAITSADVLDILKKVLNEDTITIDSNLFDFEMSSLKCFQVISKLNDRFSLDLSPHDIFENPNIGKFVKFLQESPKNSVIPIKSLPVATSYLPTFTQARMWVWDQLDEGYSRLNVTAAFRLKGPLNIDLLKKSVTHVVSNHESLRTIYDLEQGQLVQKINAISDVVHFTINRSFAIASHGLLAFLVEEAERKLDLCGESLFKCILIKLPEEDESIFFIKVHHSIVDGWSMSILLNELSDAYNKLLIGKIPMTRSMKFQVKEFANWQREVVAKAFEEHRSFWLSELRGGLPKVAIPETGIRRSNRPIYKVIKEQISESWLASLNLIDQRNGSTRFASILGIMNVFMAKYAGQQRIVMATDVSLRQVRDLEHEIGCLTNTLVLCNDINPNETLEKTLNDVKTKFYKCLKFKDYPFEQVLSDLEPEFKGLTSSIFNVLVLFQDFDVPFFDLQGISSQNFEFDNQSSLVDLQFEFFDRRESVDIKITFNADLFVEDQVVQMITRIKELLSIAAAEPHRLISSISVALEDEVRQETKFILSSDKLILDMIGESVRRTPHAPAVQYENQSISYSELGEKSDRLASLLCERYDIGVGDRVAVLLSRSDHMITALLAILKGGAAFVPIDPEYPASRIRLLLDDCSPKLIYSDREALQNLKTKIPFITKEEAGFEAEENKVEWKSKSIVPEGAAYIMYTSGTSGRPKGVVVTHRALVDYVSAFIQYFSLDSSDKVIQQSSLSFDTSIEEIFPTLASSAALLILKEGGRNVENVRKAIVEHNVTVLSTTPHLIGALNKLSFPEVKLRAIISGGDKLVPSNITSLIKRFPIFNTYGPTEGVVCASFHKVSTLEECGILGSAISSKSIYILDEHLNFIPSECYGTICIGGSIASGYINDPDLTHEHFVSNPHCKGERLFKSGDLGRWNEKKLLVFGGREDRQVKIRGYRVELQEVERVLNTCSGVEDAVVTLQDGEYSPFLVAYFLGVIDEGTIRQFAKEHLPFYMLPSQYYFLKEYPTTSNGKVDLRLLRERVFQQEKPNEPPTSRTQVIVASIVKSVLKINEVGLRVNFFEIGGDSMSATRVLGEIYKGTGAKLRLRQIFESPTVEGIASAIDGYKPSIHADMKPIEIQKDYDLSFSQKRMWFLSSCESLDPYIIRSSYTVRGNLNIVALRESLRGLIHRHEILRTVFVSKDGTPRQSVLSEDSFALPFEFLDCQESTEKLELRISEIWQLEFELSKPPLLGLHVIKTSENEFRIFFRIHHIICDGTSLQIMMSELLDTYTALLSGKRSGLKPSAIQYKDYSEWHNRMVDGLWQQRQYWLEKISGSTPLENMPYDRSRPSYQTYAGSALYRDIGSFEVEQIRNYCKQKQVSVFTYLLTNLALLIYRYSGKGDIVFGIPVDGRVHPSVAGQVGLFVNTIPFRVNVVGTKSFEALLFIVRDRLVSDLDQQAYPFDKLVDELAIERDLSRNPLFDIMASLHSIENDWADVAGVEFKKDLVINETCLFDLSFDFIENREKMSLQLQYNTDLFDQETIVVMADHFLELISQTLKNPDQEVLEINYLTTEDHALIDDFNYVEQSRSTHLAFHQLLEVNAVEHLDKTFIVSGDQRISYCEANNSVNKIANYLRTEYNIQRGDLVGLQMEKGTEMFLFLLAILKTGAVVVPIDRNIPEERLSDLVLLNNIRFIVTDAREPCPLPVWVEVIIVQDNSVWGAYPDSNLELINEAHDMAYVVFTSGSTGVPKGVAVSHFNLLQLGQGWMEAYKLKEFPVRLLQVANFTFDVFFGDLCRALISAGEIVVCHPESLFDQSGFYNLIIDNKVNILESTPGLLIPFLDFVRTEDLDLSCVKIIILGSDKLTLRDFTRISQQCAKHARVINSYGVTEATIDACFFELGEDEPSTLETPIGWPLPNTKLFVLDEHKRLVPPGIWGELYIGGDGVSLGYLNDPVLSSNKFLLSLTVSQHKLYRTGDKARLHRNGYLEFGGRIDSQVKIRGFRVELGEIEAALLTYNGVKEATAISRLNGDSDIIIAFLTGIVREETERVSEHLKRLLPDYMIPSELVILEALPLSANGKVDRLALKKLKTDYSIRKITAPQDPIESELLLLWKELLSKQEIGVDENFFSAGGHSLKIIQLGFKIEKKFKAKLSIRDLMRGLTVREQANQIRMSGQSNPAIPQSKSPASTRLSSMQKQIWVLCNGNSSNSAYNMTAAFELHGNLDINLLQDSFYQLVQKFEILRATFLLVQGEPLQMISIFDPRKFGIEINDFSGTLIREDTLNDIINTNSVVHFNLAEGPLVVLKLFKISRSRNILVVAIHHIIADGWSIGVLKRELSTFYNFNHAPGRSVPETRGEMQWINYSNGFEESLEREKEYWTKKFVDFPGNTEVPGDFTRPSSKTFNGESLSFEFNEKLYHQILEKAQASNVSAFVVLLSSLKVLLFRYTGFSDITIGSPVSLRDSAQLENAVGPFINTVCLRTVFSGKDTFNELLSKVNETVTAALDHKALAFDQLVEHLNIGHEPDKSPLFDIMIAFEHYDETDRLELGELTVSNYSLKNKSSKFDLVFNFYECNRKIDLVVDFNSDLFSTDRITLLGKHLVNLLRGLLRISKSITEYDFISKTELNQIRSITTGQRNSIRVESLIEPFQQQVNISSETHAVICGEIKLSYRQLDDFSSNLAFFLLKKCGARKGQLAGIMLDRSVGMIVGIYGVLKAGCVYVPIDTYLPKERIDYIISDSQIKMIVCSRDKPYIGDDFKTIFIEDYFEPYTPGSDAEAEFNDGIARDQEAVYSIYTSGTTGVPKGVLVSASSVNSLNNWLTDCVYRSPASPKIALLNASISFDASVQQLFSPLQNGGSIIVIDEATKRDPQAFVRQIFENRVEVLDITPSHLSAVLLILEELKEVAPIKYTLVGGEHLDETLIKRYYSVLPNSTLINVYGVTEATVNSTYKVVEKSSVYKSDLGCPLPNTELRIIDASGNVVPIGCVGEICVEGIGVGLGYLNLPELTAEKFRIKKDQVVVYYTGDKGRITVDGRIEFLGRKDRQVKVRGYRIELKEIESCLAAVPGMAMSICEVSGEGAEERYIVAYINNIDKDDEYLRSHLSAKLPEYMVPSVFVRLNDFPLNSSGKIDFTKLRSLRVTPQILLDTPIVYLNDTEKQLARLWTKVLGIDAINREANFFHLGGQSLKALKIVFGIYKEFSVSLELKDVFENPKIKLLAERIQKMRAIDSLQNLLPNDSLMPRASFAQEGLWILHQMNADQAYSVNAIFEVMGSLNREAVEYAFREIIARHQILRTVFKVESKSLIQIVKRREEFLFVPEQIYCDRASVDYSIEQFLSIPFDLDNGPLIRVAIIKSDDSKYFLAMAIHHIAIDEWSMDILRKEFASFYNGAVLGQQKKLPQLRLQYKDYAEWHRQLIVSGQLDNQFQFWKQELSPPIPTLRLNSDFDRPKWKTFKGGSENLTLDSRLSSELNRLIETHGISPFNLFLTVVGSFLSKIANQSDFIVGFSDAGRNHPELEHQVGLYTNTLPLRIQISEHDSFAKLAGRLSEKIFQCKQNQLIPFSQIVERLSIPRDPSRNPLFDVMVAFIDEDADEDLTGIRLKPRRIKSVNSKFDLTFNLVRIADQYVIDVEYNSDLYNHETIKAYVSDLAFFFTKAVENFDSLISNMIVKEKKFRSTTDNCIFK